MHTESSMPMLGRAAGPLDLEHVQIQCLYVYVEPSVGFVACFCHLSLFVYQYSNLPFFVTGCLLSSFFLVVTQRTFAVSVHIIQFADECCASSFDRRIRLQKYWPRCTRHEAGHVDSCLFRNDWKP